LDALSLGSDTAGTTLYGTDVLENDPKISPNGDRVAFMRYAPNSGANGFGWHIFVAPVASPLTETDISLADLGSSLLYNDTLPEWIDNNTLVISHIDISANRREIYTLNDDGTGRTKVNLPSGYRYADVYPFVDGHGRQKLLISAEKDSATCQKHD